VQLGASWATYRFVSIFGASDFLIIVQPVLDEKVGRWTTENKLGHSIVLLNQRTIT